MFFPETRLTVARKSCTDPFPPARSVAQARNEAKKFWSPTATRIACSAIPPRV
jgi:hypothetical protein